MPSCLVSSLQYSPQPQLRVIMRKICSSPQCRKKFKNFAKQAYGLSPAPAPSNKLLANLIVIRDVVTRWNYTHAMIKRALMLRKVITSFSLCMYGDTNCECFRRLLTGLFLRMRRFGPWCCQAWSGSFSSNSAQFSRWVHYIIQIGFELTPSTSTVTRYSPMWPTKCLGRVPPHCHGQSQCTNLCKNPSQLILSTTRFLLACALLVGRP